MKQYIPARVYGIADAVNRRKTAEKVAEFSIEIKGRSVGYGYLCSGYDGYAYLISSLMKQQNIGGLKYLIIALRFQIK